MTPRRGFLALIGGTAVSGAVQHQARAKSPTLVLPPGFTPVARARPLLGAMLARGESQMDAILSIGARVPKPAFLDWLEDGLQRSLLFSEPDHAAREREIETAVAKHGSIVEAMRAGAL